MNLRNTKKYIWIFLLCCLPLSNILWYAAHSSGDESVAASLVILTLFLPSLTELILCKISREGCDNLMILPNIRKAWKAYLFAVIGALVMNYLNELLMYFMFRGEISFHAGAFTLRGLGEIFGLSDKKEHIAVSCGSGSFCNKPAPCIGGFRCCRFWALSTGFLFRH